LKTLVIHLSPTSALYFSIAIICVNVGGGTHLLGKRETSRQEVLSLVEPKQSKDNIGFTASDCYYANE
jgi:hypothetical protein